MSHPVRLVAPWQEAGDAPPSGKGKGTGTSSKGTSVKAKATSVNSKPSTLI